MIRAIASLLLPLLLGGCLVSAVKTVVTAPVKAVGKAVDLATTSQEEADRNRGRALRKQEEQAARDARKAEMQRYFADGPK